MTGISYVFDYRQRSLQPDSMSKPTSIKRKALILEFVDVCIHSFASTYRRSLAAAWPRHAQSDHAVRAGHVVGPGTYQAVEAAWIVLEQFHARDVPERD